jgi:chromosome segregation ATPase
MLNQALNQRDALAEELKWKGDDKGVLRSQGERILALEAELAAKCSALEKERLENKFLKGLEKELEEAQTEIQELKDEMSLWETTTTGEENDRLKKELEAEKASVKCLRAENEELEKQVEECSELEDEKERLEEEVQDLETEKEELEEEVEKLEAKLEKVKGEEKSIVKCLRAENAELEKRAEMLEGEVEELQRRLRTYEPAADWGEGEFCEEHEQPKWKEGLKCGGCLEEKKGGGAGLDTLLAQELREQLKASREATDEALRVAEKNQTLYYKEVERSHAHEKRIEELEERCYDIGNKLMGMEAESADKPKETVRLAREVERLTNLVKALCAENMRLHDQFGS